MLLTSFTGAQSTGKSTLLDMCRHALLPDPEWAAYSGHEYKQHWVFIPEVTRLIKREFHVDINEQGTDDTQLLIMNQHLINTIQFKNNLKRRGHYYMMDRCVMDGLVYSKYLHNHGRIEDCTYAVVESMYHRLLPSLDAIFYTHPEDIPIHDDGERSVNPQFRNEIIQIYDDVLYGGQKWIIPSNVVVLKGNRYQRMETIMSKLRDLGGI